MNQLLKIMDNCTEYQTIIGLVKGIVNLICYAVPVIIIVLTVIDVAKVATSGNADDKLKKETSQKVVTRLIYSVIIFLVPTIISLLFRIISGASSGEIDISKGGGCDCSLIDMYLDKCNKGKNNLNLKGNLSKIENEEVPKIDVDHR